MRALTTALGVVIVTLALASAGSPGSERTTVAGVLLQPAGGSGVTGAAHFRQSGQRLSGWVVVWGLRPGSKHAVHIHGPGSRCGRKAPPVAAHRDLVADRRGVAFLRFSTAARSVLRRGFYYNVHAGPSTVDPNPEIACGDIVPGS
jgi:hypothetical protein